MNITIQEATVEDAENISFLGKTTFDQSFGHLFKDRIDIETYFDTTFSKIKIENSIHKSHNIYWIVKEGTYPIGYGKLQLNSPNEFIDGGNVCKLQKIYLLKGNSSKGIGHQLQHIIFEKAKKEGCQHLWLSVLKENTRAIDFYKRSGYKIVGEHPFKIGKQKFVFWVMAIQF